MKRTGQPDPSCYGCLGTGTLQGFGSRPGTPCLCLSHDDNCDPESHSAACQAFVDGDVCDACGKPLRYADDGDSGNDWEHWYVEDAIECAGLKPGLEFHHARQLQEVQGTPCRLWPAEVCTVTRVTDSLVYYRNSTGFKLVTARDKFPEEVRDVIG